MARRRVAGGSRIDPGMFLQGQGGGSPMEQMALAMKILGEQERTEREYGLGQQQLEELLSRHKGERELGEKRLVAEERRANEEQAFREWQKQEAGRQADLAAQTKRDEIAAALQRSQDEFNAKAYELASPEERPFYLKSMSPQGRAAVVEMEALKQGNVARTQAPALETAYKLGDWDAVKKIVGTLSPEIMARPEFKWQEWNQAQAGAAPSDITGGAGLLGLLWNVPGMTANLQNKAIESGIRGLTGQEVDIPDIRYTSPVSPTGGAVASQVLRNVPGVSTFGQARAMAQPNPVAGPRPDVDVDSLMSLIALRGK